MADMDQSNIDALLNGIGSDDKEDSATAPSGEIDQDGIDTLLAGGIPNEDPPAATPSGEIDQDGIDALLAGDIQNESEDPLFSSDEESSSDDMESLLAEIQNDPSLDQISDEVNVNDLLTELQTEVPFPDSDMGQNDIDTLMNSVSADPAAGAIVEKEEEGVNVDFLLDMKLVLTFEVGRNKMVISDLLSLGQGSVIELHRLVGEDLDLLVSGRLIAKGEVVVVNEKFGVRILNIIPPENRIQAMRGFDRI